MTDKDYMSLAIKISENSQDIHTKVGSVLVNQDNNIISIGYNHYPKFKSNSFPKNREGEWINTKYPFIIHSEIDTILNCEYDTYNSKIYVTLFPCNECAKAIVQSGVKEVVYLNDKYKDTDSVKAAKEIFDKTGVKYRKYES